MVSLFTHTVGIISDTHGLLRPEAIEALQGSNVIMHAGDIGKLEVIEELQAIAPVVAVRGNIDKGEWATRFAEYEVLKLGEHYLYTLHNLNELDLDPVAAGFDVVIAGHSHRPKISHKDGVMFLNPGSAGPRRFDLPIAVARLCIDGESVEAEIVELRV